MALVQGMKTRAVFERDNATLRSVHYLHGSNRPGRFTPPRCPIISDNGHLEGHYPTYGHLRNKYI